MTGPPRADGGFDGRPTSQPDQVTHEIGDDEPPSIAVVRAVAALTNRSPLDLDPLYDVIDPDYLDGAFADGGVSAELSFPFAGCEVTVTDEHVRVHGSADDT